MDLGLKRLSRGLRYRLGLRVVAPQLAGGTDDGVQEYYNSRLSDCSFLADSVHYERPRIDWMLGRVGGGALLEIGCADGAVTAMLASRVDRIVALDVCQASIGRVEGKGLANVRTHVGLLEQFETHEKFDWVIMSEVLEHLRDPQGCLTRVLSWLRPGGQVLLSSPDGAWEGDSIEHLHVFDMESWSRMLVRAGARSYKAFRIADREGRDRWLGAEIESPSAAGE